MEKVVKEAHLSVVALIFRLIIDMLASMIIIGIFWLVRDIIIFTKSKLIVTTNYIKGKKGLTKSEELNSPLNKITGVQVKQGLFGKIFNYGVISITTPTTVFEFNYISNPYQLQTIINNQIIVSEDERMDKQAKKIADVMQKNTEKIVDAMN